MPKYLKTKLKLTSNKKTSADKTKPKTSPKLKKKSKKLTKTRVREIVHFRRLISYILMLFSVVVELFNVSLIINGGWDDISLFLFIGAPLLAFLSICVSYDSRKKYLAIKRDVWLGLVLLVFTGITFCIELMITLVAPLVSNKVEDSDRGLIGQYNCADTEADRDAEKYNVEIYLSDKEFSIMDYNNPKEIADGSYGVFEAGTNLRRLKAIIKENKSTDSKRGFAETSYLFRFGSDENVEISSENYYITRYCKRIK